ncbi:hypothetical protein LTR53_012561 [Teratosphaeriaceae sp. CCFEE 6253]|nr:hypothetical protein LTR53_012561 [Teratosphaeriaceae sp. CCFEE 6253]
MSSATIDTLLNLAPDHPDRILAYLQTHSDLASAQDAHGYSLVHAATSYNHPDLLRTLIEEHHVDPNIIDEDGETALFNAESVDIARELLRLGVNPDLPNTDGQTAAEKLDDEDEQPEVAAFLRQATHLTAPDAVAPSTAQAESAVSETNGLHAPPPLPNGVQIEVGTMQPDEAGEAPDPEFRRRIEELAARDDFQEASGQQELRRLVEEAVTGLTEEQRASVRRRLG